MKLAEALSISPITLTMQLYAQPYGLELTTQMRDRIKNLQEKNARMTEPKEEENRHGGRECFDSLSGSRGDIL